MEGELKIVGLYEYNDVYQVINSTDTVLFQGSKADCICFKAVKQIVKSML